MKPYCYILFLSVLITNCRPQEDNIITQFAGKPEVPASIKREHEYLLSEITKITLLGDSTAKAAMKLKELMQHHFSEEEDYVLPSLGLLPALAEGQIPSHSKEVISLAEKLRAQWVHMNVEHQLIKAHMAELIRAADKENHAGITSLEQEITKHVAIEEEVLFPAALLVGEYLKLKSKEQ